MTRGSKAGKGPGTDVPALADPAWADRLTEEDQRALTPLFWTHLNLYGRFEIDFDQGLDLASTDPGSRESP